MQIALISDTHGNITALNAVLADLKTQGADQVIFLGDAATIGAQPNETLETLQALNCVCILGNHDEAVLHPERAERLQIAAPLHPALDWCIQRMSRVDLQFLESFQATHETQLTPRVSMLCFHGSPLANTDMILSTTPAETLEGFFRGRVSSVWVGGHTHIQMLRRVGDKLLINPGSVGNAFQHSYSPGFTPELLPWAEYAILRAEAETISVDLRRVPFDTQKTLRLITASDLPGKEWWLNQYA